jgi:hypothetical protein
MEQEEPNFMCVLSDKHEPKLAKESNDIPEPTRVIPYTVRVLPIRETARRETAEPTLKASNTDKHDPNRAMPYMLKAAGPWSPMRRNERMDMEDPRDRKSTIESDDPNRALPNRLMVLPKRTAVWIDTELPI